MDEALNKCGTPRVSRLPDGNSGKATHGLALHRLSACATNPRRDRLNSRNTA